MPILSAILSSLGGDLVDRILGRFTGLFEAYFKKEITQAQLHAGLVQALIGGAVEVEKAHADSITKTYASFMDAVKGSPALQRMLAIVVYSQLFVLFWHQFCIPAIVAFVRYYYVPGWNYPSSGSTVDWSYALIAGLCGLGATVLRVGPGKFDWDSLKRLVGK